MRFAVITTAVLLAGCIPPAQKDRTDEVLRAIDAGKPAPLDLSAVTSELRALRADVQRSRQTEAAPPRASGYTGIKVYTCATRGKCPLGDRQVDELYAWVRGTEWTIGGESAHFQIHADDSEVVCPRFELWRSGELLDEWAGYQPVDSLVLRHPNCSRAAKGSRRTSTRSAGGSYGSAGVAYGVSYSDGGSVGGFGGYGSSGEAYGYSLPVVRRGRICVNGVCW